MAMYWLDEATIGLNGRRNEPKRVEQVKTVEGADTRAIPKLRRIF